MPDTNLQHQDTELSTVEESSTQLGQDAYRRLEACVKENPHSSVLVALGAGLGVGIVVGMALAGPHHVDRRSWFDRRTAERLGRRMMSRLGDWVPDSVSDRF